MFEPCARGAKPANQIREPAASRNFVPVGGAQPPASLSVRDAGSAQIARLWARSRVLISHGPGRQNNQFCIRRQRLMAFAAAEEQRDHDWGVALVGDGAAPRRRIRDKTGCRRRADLTRLALTAELV